VRWIRDRAYPVRDAAGTVYRIVGIAEDITTLKCLEEESSTSVTANGVALGKTSMTVYVTSHRTAFAAKTLEENRGVGFA